MSRHSKREEDEPTTAWWWVKAVVSWMLLAVMVAFLAVTIAVPKLTGSTPYTVLTGSMIPTYPPGTLVVVKPQDPETLNIGDAITYQWESGKPAVVTHRIVSAGRNAKGETVFTTKGDNNNAPDEREVVPGQIRGKVWYAVPYAGYVNNFITGKQRSILLVVVVGGLLIYAATMFVSSGRDSLRKRRERSAVEAGDAETVEMPVVEDASSPAAPKH